MKKCLFIFLVLSIISSTNFSQKKFISGKIIDIETKKGIPNVHIYSATLSEGTTTDADGNFYLIVTKNDKLHISCFGYENKIIKLLANDPEKLTVKMNLKMEYLNEIVINSKALTVNEIMTKVFF
jgi:hypothetical protein|tara:strand:- start:1756 stop:2130 length:375 start_codon:yes stop_codon:yes gene_type:complete